jgi:Holliday junction resolvasome RuvABC ATP-dependent DNA helicase subunit
MILDLFRKDIEFDNLQWYDDIKGIVRRALDAEDNYNLLFIGPPASAKTLFLLGILESRKGVYFDGCNTTSRILDVLEEKRPKIICIDELDKMPKRFQEKLLNFMESGHIKVDQMRKQYDFRIKGAKVFAACNQITRLSRPLRSRFLCLRLPRYNEEQFLEVSAKVLPKLKIADVIGKAVWDQRGDIRDVMSIGRLVRKNDGPEEVEQILRTMTKY